MLPKTITVSKSVTYDTQAIIEYMQDDGNAVEDLKIGDILDYMWSAIEVDMSLDWTITDEHGDEI